MNKEELSACKGKLLPYMEEVRTSYGLDMVFFMMTDIINESTELLMVGEMCKEVIENGTLMYQKEWQNIKDRQSFLEL